MTAAEPQGALSSDSKSGAQDPSSQKEERFEMYEEDPMHHPSDDYLEKLSVRFRQVCDETTDLKKRQECWESFEESLALIRRWRKEEGWYGPSSTSYHFKGDELFSGFVHHDGRTHERILMPWEFPTRKEIDEYLANLKRVNFVHKKGPFAQTLAKFVLKNCQGKIGKPKDPVVIDLPPSTEENPIFTEIREKSDLVVKYDHYWPLYLVGHGTVLKSMEDEDHPSSMIRELDKPVQRHQLMFFDLTLIGRPLPWGIRFYPFEGVRFYNCTISHVYIECDAMFIDCQGETVVIHADRKVVRMLNCKFDRVDLGLACFLAKGCEFGSLDAQTGPVRNSVYFLEDCKVGEMFRTRWPWATTLDKPWPEPEKYIRRTFEEMQQKAFEPLHFQP